MLKNFEGARCLKVIKVKSDKEAIVIDCGSVSKIEKSHTIELKRITGANLNTNVYYKPDFKTIREEAQTEVWCKKAKKKF